MYRLMVLLALLLWGGVCTMGAELVVPNTLHLVHLNGGELTFYVYLNFIAAMDNLRPDKVLFHYIVEPTGRFYKKLVHQKKITPVRHMEPIEILGNRPGPTDWAHKSDIIRLDVLKQHGGIYIDTDVLVLRSFDHFRQYPFTMGNWRPPDLELILCNAVVLSTPDSAFLSTWYEAYRTADFKCWDCQSVVRPTEMARHSTRDPPIHVANRTAFYTVDWLARSSAELLGEEKKRRHRYTAPFDGIFAQHLWNARHKVYSHITLFFNRLQHSQF
jgi:hypothetical protein